MRHDTRQSRVERTVRPRMLVVVALCVCISGVIIIRPTSVLSQSQSPIQSPSANQLQLVTTRTGLQANDYLDWKQLTDTPILSLPISFPVTVKTHQGEPIQLLKPGTVSRMVQGDSWKGGFGKGDVLVATNIIGDAPLTIKFGGPVVGVGAQIEGWQPGAFDAELRVYDDSDRLLGSVKVSGVQHGPMEYPQHEGKAPFIGILSDHANIRKVEFDTVTYYLFFRLEHKFLVNRLDIVTAPVPETLKPR